MKDNSSMKLAGYLVPFGPRPPANRTPFGLQSMVYGTLAAPFGVEVDERGNAARFLPMRPMAANELVSTSVDFDQRLGEAAHYLFVRSAEAPTDVIVEPWDKMNATVLKAYPGMRKDYVRYPLAGYRLAGFVAGLVPGYAAANGHAAELNLDTLQFEADLLKMDDADIFQESPEVQRMAEDHGITLRGRYGRNPTPPPTIRP